MMSSGEKKRVLKKPKEEETLYLVCLFDCRVNNFGDVLFGFVPLVIDLLDREDGLVDALSR